MGAVGMNDLQTGFLISMAVVIAVAALIIILFNRLRQPLILGYLAAGMIVGPLVVSAQYSVQTEGGSFVISAQPVVEMLARLGIVLITFSIGLEFSLKRLRKIGITVITAAALEILIMIGIGFQLGLALGWDPLPSTLLGAMLSVASTMIIIRSLKESGGLDNEKARLVIGLLIVEDFAAVLILAAVSGIVSTGTISAKDIGELVLKMGIFVAASIVFGLALIPRLVDYVGRQRSGELLVITVLGLCFTMAVFARWIGMSEAIGAFVMGVIVSESKHIGDVVRKIEPIRDLFGAIFFISVGMLATQDPSLFIDVKFLLTAAAIIVVFILAKMFSCTLSTFICGFGARNSFQAGLSMIAIGEFTLMIASVAIGASQIPSELNLYPTIVLVTTATALVVPYSVRYTDKATRALEGIAPKSILYLASYLNLVVRNMRRRSQSSVRISNEMMNSISRLFIYIVVVMVTLLVSVNITQNADDYSYIFGGNTDLLLMTMLAGAIVVVIFAMYGIWSRTTRLIHASTSEAILGTRSAENIGYEATASSLKWAFLAFYVVVGFIVVSPLIQSIVQQIGDDPRQSGLIFAIVVIVIIAVAVVSLWGSLKTIDKKLEEVFERRDTSPYSDTSGDLAEIEDIITAMERGRH
jgi:Kef-type K+ transport system membrane component KefB